MKILTQEYKAACIKSQKPAELRIATTSFQIGNGLEQQIEQYLSDFPKTKLVIIDTFQKVRDSKSTGGKSGMYAGDYDDVSALKNISDKYGIAVMVVHHVRKLKDVSDPFNEVSGSTGITGAADTNFVLKRSRANETGTMLATGRDIAYQELTLKFDNRSHLWSWSSERIWRIFTVKKYRSLFSGWLIIFRK